MLHRVVGVASRESEMRMKTWRSRSRCYLGKSRGGMENRACKGPEAGAHRVCWRNGKLSVAGPAVWSWR